MWGVGGERAAIVLDVPPLAGWLGRVGGECARDLHMDFAGFWRGFL